MQIFLDANTYLSYLGKGADLTPLKQLKSLISNKKVTLLVPQQTYDEYQRNLVRRMEQEKKGIEPNFPTQVEIPKNGKELMDVQKLDKQFKKYIKDIKESIKKSEAEKEKYSEHLEESQVLIEELFSLGKRLTETVSHIEKARLRYLKGNPPQKCDKSGKALHDESYGDAITWELLLEMATKDNIKIISHDSDYADVVDGERSLNKLLFKEWSSRTKKTISLVTSLGQFINKYKKEVVVKPETVKKEVSGQNYTPGGIFPTWTTGNLNFGTGVTQVSPWSLTTGTSGFVVGGGNSTFIPTSGSATTWMITNTSSLYCPYCKTVIPTDTVSALYNNQHTCPNCKRTFTIIDRN